MDITASVLSLAGKAFPDKPRFTPIQRAQAAQQHGITSIGVCLDEIDDLPRRPDVILNMASIPEAEWVDLGCIPSTRTIGQLRMLHEQFGVTRVNVGACDPSTTAKVAARNLDILAASAPFVDFAVEPVAFGSPDMRTIYGVADVLNRAGNPDNAGILLDCWQVTQNGSLPWQHLKRVNEIQLCGRLSRDVAYQAYTINDKIKQASQDRLYMGEDMFDFRGWLASVNPDGKIPVSYEVPRREHAHMTLEQIAEGIAADLAALA